MKIETLHTPLFACAEVPFADAFTNDLFFVEAAGKGFYRYQNNKLTVLLAEFESTSMVKNSNDSFVLSSLDGLYHYQNHSVIKLKTDIAITQINEICADAQGNIWAGQATYDEHQHFSTGYLYKINSEGKVTTEDDSIVMGNGMDFSPDNTIFYLAETSKKAIYKYTYNVATALLTNKKIFANIPSDRGIPDGLCVDSEGFVWVACFFGSCVMRFDPDGKVEQLVELPVEQITSLCFGGMDLNEIYITSGNVQWPTKLYPPSFHLKGNKGGQIFKIKTDIRGKIKHSSNIT